MYNNARVIADFWCRWRYRKEEAEKTESREEVGLQDETFFSINNINITCHIMYIVAIGDVYSYAIILEQLQRYGQLQL